MSEYAAYFDDSGHPDDQAAVVVAGFIASEANWLLFEREWKEYLDRESIDVFHTTDFMNCKVWPQHKKEAILRRLVTTIQIRTIRPIGHAVLIADYREVNDQYAFEECIGTPYALAGRTVAKSLNNWKRKHPEDKLLIFFEDGTKHKGDFIDVMERDGLPCPAFLKKSEAVPLQAADWLAWEMFQVLKSGQASPFLKKVVGSLPDNDPDLGIYRKQNLLDMCKPSEGLPNGIPLRSNLAANAHIAHHSSPKKRRKRSMGG